MTTTKLPWRCASVAGAYRGWDSIVDADGAIVCRLALNEPDNADLIVRAVNAHAELLLAAKEAVILIYEIVKMGKGDPTMGTVFPRLMAAIAKAEGKL
jgi:hypothetical protein